MRVCNQADSGFLDLRPAVSKTCFLYSPKSGPRSMWLLCIGRIHSSTSCSQPYVCAMQHIDQATCCLTSILYSNSSIADTQDAAAQLHTSYSTATRMFKLYRESPCAHCKPYHRQGPLLWLQPLLKVSALCTSLYVQTQLVSALLLT